MDTPERRENLLGRDAFERAVTEAATIATQNVAQIHRRRLVRQTAIATFCVCILIATIMAFILKGIAVSQAQAESRSLAVSNCQLVKAIATPLADFVRSDAHLRVQQAQIAERNSPIVKKFQHLLGAKNYAKALKESNRLNSDTTSYWDHNVAPRLQQVAGADCELRVQ